MEKSPTITTTIIIFAAISILFSQTSGAANDTNKIAFHLPSALHMQAVLVKPEYVVLEGSFTFSGRYEFIGDQENENGKPILRLYPDNLNNIPRFYDRGRLVKSMPLDILNVKAAGNILFGKPRTEKLYSGEYATLSGKAIIILEGLVASYNGCNRLSFTSEVMRLVNVTEQATVGEAKKQPTC